jgi:hypothetical protein
METTLAEPAHCPVSARQIRAVAYALYLVSQGIPEDKVQICAEGQQNELSRGDVTKLQTDAQQKPDAWMTHNNKATWMAYNRRVDIVLESAGPVSTQTYPNGASDSRLLWQRAEPPSHEVELAGGGEASTQQLQAVGNSRTSCPADHTFARWYAR